MGEELIYLAYGCFGFCHIDGDTATCPECGCVHRLVNGEWTKLTRQQRRQEKRSTEWVERKSPDGKAVLGYMGVWLDRNHRRKCARIQSGGACR